MSLSFSFLVKFTFIDNLRQGQVGKSSTSLNDVLYPGFMFTNEPR